MPEVTNSGTWLRRSWTPPGYVVDRLPASFRPSIMGQTRHPSKVRITLQSVTPLPVRACWALAPRDTASNDEPDQVVSDVAEYSTKNGKTGPRRNVRNSEQNSSSVFTPFADRSLPQRFASIH